MEVRGTVRCRGCRREGCERVDSGASWDITFSGAGFGRCGAEKAGAVGPGALQSSADSRCGWRCATAWPKCDKVRKERYSDKETDRGRA